MPWPTWNAAVATARDTFAAVSRMLAPIATVGVTSGAPLLAGQEYPGDNAMAAMADFAWVRIAVSAVAEDAAGVPLMAKAKPPGGGDRARTAIAVDDPILARLESPNSFYSGFLFRKQLWVDFLLTGNCYVWLGEGVMWRLHPGSVRVMVGALGMPVGYEVADPTLGSGKRVLRVEEVLHIRDASWSADLRGAYGASAIRCLHEDLLTEQATRRMSRRNAERGRPDMLFMAKSTMGRDGADQAVAAYERGRLEGASAVALTKGFDAQQLSWSPRDLEFGRQSEETRDRILALFQVPPARAGLPNANYGTSKTQMRQYWGSIIRRARMFADAWTSLAQPGVYIEHDFSDVEALQTAYTERLMRVTTWVGMGASPAAAAAAEGFIGAPVGDEPLVETFHSPRRPRREPDEPQKSATVEVLSAPRLPPVPVLAGVLSGYLDGAAERWEAAAVALRAGASAELLAATEAGRLFGVLCGLGVPPSVARWHADDEAAHIAEVVQTLAEVALEGEQLGLGQVDAFGRRAAERMAAHLHREMETAA